MTKRDSWTIILVVGSAAWTVGTLWLLWGAKLFRPGGEYPTLDDLDHLGSFLSGFLTPIAVAWAARSLFLQRAQMFQAMQDMALQRDEAERQRLATTDPNIQILRGIMIQSTGHRHTITLELKNHGATARRFTVSYRFRYSKDRVIAAEHEVAYTQDLPGPNGTINFDVDLPIDRPLLASELEAVVVVHTERLDGKVSRFVCTAQDGVAKFTNRRQTAVPGLTMDTPIVVP